MTKERFYIVVRPTREVLVATILFIVTLSVFLLSPVHQVTDSNYSMLLSESLLHHGSFELDHYAIPHGEPKWLPHYFSNGDIHQLELVNGRLYYHLPPGTPVLSVPFVGLMNIFGISAANADGTYNAHGEERIESILAALLMAALACVFFYMARLLLPTGWSAVIALGGSFGTQIWSTTSRAMWSDTWGTLLLGIALLMMLAQEAGKHNLKPVLLATIFSWLYFVRPTYSVHIFAVTVYLLLFYRHLIFGYVMTGAIWLAGFMFYSWRIYHHLLPSYFQPARLDFAAIRFGLPGSLFSPGRGLLVYVPVLFFLAYLLFRYRHQIRFPRLVYVAVFVILCHVVIASATLHWWGGHSFGPRFTTGLVPWFVLLGVLGVHAMRQHGARLASDRRRKRLELAFGATLLLFSTVINGLGAIDRATWAWNMRPSNIDYHDERLWDWRQPQFLAGFVRPPITGEPPLVQPRLDFTQHDADKYLWYGWSDPERDYRWTDDKEAGLAFSLNQISDLRLQMKLGSFIVPGKHDQQRLLIDLNGRHVGAVLLQDGAPEVYSFNLPAAMLRRQNALILELPDAVSPASLHVNEDERLLGVAVYWVEFHSVADSQH